MAASGNPHPSKGTKVGHPRVRHLRMASPSLHEVEAFVLTRSCAIPRLCTKTKIGETATNVRLGLSVRERMTAEVKVPTLISPKCGEIKGGAPSLPTLGLASPSLVEGQPPVRPAKVYSELPRCSVLVAVIMP